MKKFKSMFQKKSIKYPAIAIGLALLVVISNLYLQWSQNSYSTELMINFAFSWHTEKFLLGCMVLAIFLLFLCSAAGSIIFGGLAYAISIGILGFADAQKMYYRTEPIYPDDLKMITEFGLLKEMIGTGPFLITLALGLFGVGLLIWALYRSRLLSRSKQILRCSGLLVSVLLLVYISYFNSPNNLLRKAFDRTAYWIPYSQTMNYYNNGFIGGFLYNLNVEAMEEPKGYSKETIETITNKYSKQVQEKTDTSEEQPNIVFVMSESFSNPLALNGITANKDPLSKYHSIADQTYSGQMLSQNYGGGTANIEFEALTSFSMALLNSQLTTPYTMLVPKMKEFPSIVSLLNSQKYQTTAIHPYNTSMYKRKDVYSVFGFDQFISENTMNYTDKIENNPYISDESAYKEVLDILKEEDNPQFVHLVTMQTHMPYSSKYTQSEYISNDQDNPQSINNYMQDIAYSSEALKSFITSLEQVNRRTLVVFWGDHLPSIYSDEVKENNDEVAMHLTEFLMYDTQNQLTMKKTHDAVTSPFYFAPSLFEQSGLAMPAFYQLVTAVKAELPAFEKGFDYKNGQWSKTVSLNKAQEEVYEDYQLIQYDIVAGKQYSLATDFFQ